jgi:4-hydroxybenzoate polyprenyltransferase
MLRDCIRLCRVRHWVKNAFVLAPLVFSLNFNKPVSVVRAFVMCASFCLAASGVYVINDIVDRRRDRLHPKKKNRPIASGAVSVRCAWSLASILLAASAGLALALTPAALAVVVAYIGMNVAYSLALQNQAFIDVMVIAGGFLLRLGAGALAIHVRLSQWMLLATFFLSLFLGFGKRRRELIVTGGSAPHRPVLARYSVELLNCLIIISASLTIITYALYVVSSASMTIPASARLIITVPFVVFGVFRYLHVVYTNNSGGDPAEVLLNDRALLTDIGLWVLTVVVLLTLARLSGVGS